MWLLWLCLLVGAHFAAAADPCALVDLDGDGQRDGTTFERRKVQVSRIGFSTSAAVSGLPAWAKRRTGRAVAQPRRATFEVSARPILKPPADASAAGVGPAFAVTSKPHAPAAMAAPATTGIFSGPQSSHFLAPLAPRPPPFSR
jgi:hypothetical protein